VSFEITPVSSSPCILGDERTWKKPHDQRKWAGQLVSYSGAIPEAGSWDSDVRLPTCFVCCLPTMLEIRPISYNLWSAGIKGSFVSNIQ
jgi:hypothetical protein